MYHSARRSVVGRRLLPPIAWLLVRAVRAETRAGSPRAWWGGSAPFRLGWGLGSIPISPLSSAFCVQFKVFFMTTKDRAPNTDADVQTAFSWNRLAWRILGERPVKTLAAPKYRAGMQWGRNKKVTRIVQDSGATVYTVWARHI